MKEGGGKLMVQTIQRIVCEGGKGIWRTWRIQGWDGVD